MNLPKIENYLHKYVAYRINNTINDNVANNDEVMGNITDKNGKINKSDVDTFILSEESRQQMMLDREAYMERLVNEINLESAKQQGEAMEKGMEDLGKIIMVFRRLADGDIVPYSDEKKLMDYNNEMYQCAKSMQAIAINEKSKEHKSLWEDEEEVTETENVDIGEKITEFIKEQKENISVVEVEPVDSQSSIEGSSIDIAL